MCLACSPTSLWHLACKCLQYSRTDLASLCSSLLLAVGTLADTNMLGPSVFSAELFIFFCAAAGTCPAVHPVSALMTPPVHAQSVQQHL